MTTPDAGTGNELRERVAAVCDEVASRDWLIPGTATRANAFADAVLPLIEAAVTEAEERARREQDEKWIDLFGDAIALSNREITTEEFRRRTRTRGEARD